MYRRWKVGVEASLSISRAGLCRARGPAGGHQGQVARGSGGRAERSIKPKLLEIGFEIVGKHAGASSTPSRPAMSALEEVIRGLGNTADDAGGRVETVNTVPPAPAPLRRPHRLGPRLVLLPATRDAHQRCEGLTGRQKPMTRSRCSSRKSRPWTATRVWLQLLEARRRAGPVRACEGDRTRADRGRRERLGELWNKLCWAGASAGRSGLSTQAIGAFDVALYDLKAKRAGCRWPSCSDRTAIGRLLQHLGRFSAHAAGQLLVNAAASIERGIGGIKLKVGQPDRALASAASKRCASTWAITCR